MKPGLIICARGKMLRLLTGDYGMFAQSLKSFMVYLAIDQKNGWRCELAMTLVESHHELQHLQ
jgi:hypothetical protein